MTWIQTYSGKRVDLFNPDIYEIDIGDIAHSLSVQPRFNGHTRVPYSVAQHSLYVASLLPDEYQIYGLMHDMSEAYIGDMCYPLKSSSAMTPFRDIERNLQLMIYERFNIVPNEPKELGEIDRRMALTEGRQLMGDTEGWAEDELYEPYNIDIVPWGELVVKDIFLHYFYLLNNGFSIIPRPSELNKEAKDLYFYNGIINKF